MDSNLLVKNEIPLRHQRDLRVDFVRGLALFIIFVDHNAVLDERRFGWLTAFTLHRYSFIDAADVFFFLSGYVSGLVYTRILVSRGLVACLGSAFRRCLQLYSAQIILFLLSLGLIRWAAIHNIGSPLSVFHYFDTATNISIATLTMRHPPPFFGLLPIYMLFIVLTPVVLYLRTHSPYVLAILSLSAYSIAQITQPFLHTYADSFDPLAWQLVFVVGLLIGYRRTISAGGQWSPRRWLLCVAICALLVIALVRLAPSRHIAALFHTHALEHVVPQPIPLTDKQDVGPLRLVNLALWVIVISAIKPSCDVFKSWWTRAPLVCGENSLVVFCCGVFLNYAGAICLARKGDEEVLSLAWTTIGCAALIGTATGWSRLRARVRPRSTRVIGSQCIPSRLSSVSGGGGLSTLDGFTGRDQGRH